MRHAILLFLDHMGAFFYVHFPFLVPLIAHLDHALGIRGLEWWGFLGGTGIALGWGYCIIDMIRTHDTSEFGITFTIISMLGSLCWLIYALDTDAIALLFWEVAEIVIICIGICLEVWIQRKDKAGAK